MAFSENNAPPLSALPQYGALSGSSLAGEISQNTQFVTFGLFARSQGSQHFTSLCVWLITAFEEKRDRQICQVRPVENTGEGMDTPRHRSDSRRLRGDCVLGCLRGAIGSPSLHFAGAGQRRYGDCERLGHIGAGALGDRSNDFCGLAPGCDRRGVRGCDIGAISMDRDVVITGHGDIAGDADCRDCTAHPYLRADTVDCAVDM